MICRDYQSLFCQYTELSNIVKYIDHLKSRIYKTFFKESLLKVNSSQSSFINSPLVLIASVRQILKNICLQVDCFEIGYMVFCLSHNYLLDASFYYYYQEDSGCNMLAFVEHFIEKVKYFIVTLLFESYHDYLCSGKDNPLIFCGSYPDMLQVFKGSQVSSQTLLCLNLEPSFVYTNLSIFIDRLLIDASVKSYLAYRLKNGRFNSLVYYFNLSFGYTVLTPKPPGVFCKFVNILLLHIFREILVVSGALCDSKVVKMPVNIAFFELTIFIFSCRLSLSELLLNTLEKFLQFNGVYLKKRLKVFSSLFARMNLSSGFVLSTSQYSYAQSIMRPSLHVDLALMQRTSLAISRSISQPLFLFIIRLNMLLFSWLSFSASSRHIKPLCVADYLISLKARHFVKLREGLSYYLHILLLEKIQFNLGASSLLVLVKLADLIFASSKSNDFYRYYVLAKIRWIYRIKCLTS